MGSHFQLIQGKELLQQELATSPQLWKSSFRTTRPSENAFPDILPGLLKHYDNYLVRHQWLSQSLEITTDLTLFAQADALDALYLLGDCLEWFLQASPNIDRPEVYLREYLHQRYANDPLHDTKNLAKLVNLDGSPHILSRNRASPQTMSIGTVELAIQQCLYYRENLTLALTSQHLTRLVTMMVGCFLGAWTGTAIIPINDITAIPTAQIEALKSQAEHLYQSWTGVVTPNIADCFEAFPLDL
ncbi:MAG: hypothetical protein AAF821_03175 [Cyanobacteria bacterium P01_D01_bin.156]